MITPSEASQIIDACQLHCQTVQIPLANCQGRILMEDIVADRPFPPYNRVTMDGIAIRFSDFASGTRNFVAEGIQYAGTAPSLLSTAGHCIEVMTGAVLPLQTDTVVRYEDITLHTNPSGYSLAQLNTDRISQGQNVHLMASDKNTGAILCPKGSLLRAPEIAVAASAGYSTLWVSEPPSVALVSTGDELVEVHQQPLPHQIRQSNTYMLQAALSQWNIPSERYYLPDNQAYMTEVLSSVLTKHQVVILSGAVSAGKADFLPEVLQQLGVKQHFHKVAQRPGKPFWFGSCNTSVIFALPGNPVSTYLCYIRYVEPWLKTQCAYPAPEAQFAALQRQYRFEPTLTCFLQVKTRTTPDGRIIAEPLAGGGSGDHANLTNCNGFLELPASQKIFHAGEVFRLYSF
jgi:molybdopterin molybdotransferase